MAVISDPKGRRKDYCCCHQGSWGQAQVTAHTFPGACTVHHCQGSRNPGPTSLGESTACLGCGNFMPASAAAGTPHTSQLWLPYPSLSLAWVSKWALISCRFHPSLAGAGNRCLRAAHMQRQGPNQSWTPGAVWPKKRKGKFSMQPQEQRIKPLPAVSLVSPASVEYLNRQVFPQLRLWTLGATVDFGGKYMK